MATSPEAVRTQLAVVTTAATADLTDIAATVAPERRATVMLESLPLIVPPYYDAAGLLAVDWYGELRDESQPSTSYAPNVIGDPATDWIERAATTFARDLNGADLEHEMQQMVDEVARLAAKEVARGFRDSVLGNARIDQEAVGWSRVARGAACKFCLMLSGRGAVYRSQSSAIFAAHKGCNCAARPEFRNGDHGPEASAIQYLASSKRAKSDAAQEQRNARLRDYLNENFPDAPG